MRCCCRAAESPGQIADDSRRRRVREGVLRRRKPVAAICHGPWMIVEADKARGLAAAQTTSLRSTGRQSSCLRLRAGKGGPANSFRTIRPTKRRHGATARRRSPLVKPSPAMGSPIFSREPTEDTWSSSPWLQQRCCWRSRSILPCPWSHPKGPPDDRSLRPLREPPLPVHLQGWVTATAARRLATGLTDGAASRSVVLLTNRGFEPRGGMAASLMS
jgi:hypothetical protein